jgi:hypothetical protein
LFFTRGDQKKIACLFNLSTAPITVEVNEYEEIANSPRQNAELNKKNLTLEGNGFIFLKSK